MVFKLNFRVYMVVLPLAVFSIFLTSCSAPQYAKEAHLVCFSSSGTGENFIDFFQNLDGYTFNNSGEVQLQNTKLVQSYRHPIPKGVPLHFTVRDQGGKIVIIGSNLGARNAISLSFFVDQAVDDKRKFVDSVLDGILNINEGLEIKEIDTDIGFPLNMDEFCNS